MKFFNRLLMAVLYWGGIAAARSRLSNKYHQSNFVADSIHLAHYQARGSSASRLSPNMEHNYAAAMSDPARIVPEFGHSKTTTRIPILRSEYNNDGSGNYHFGFETGNGIKREESGHYQGSWPGGAVKIVGSYSYTGDDGKLYSINYKADRNGFRAEGEHLPTPPPIPREIQETLHLHQHGGGKYYSSSASLAFPADYANGRPLNFASASCPSKGSVLIPIVHYLPPQQNQSNNYERLH